MKIKKGFALKKSSGQNIIVSTSKGGSPLHNTITLSETAAFLWIRLSEKSMTKEELLNALLDNYEISTVLALNDIDVFIKAMKENGIIEEDEK